MKLIISLSSDEVAAKLFMIFIDSATTSGRCHSGSWLTGYTYYDC
jgi:hypothetical protein